MSQALYRKWRPMHWEDVVGQEHVVQTLRNAVAAGRVAHAQLFAGPRGTGKTTTARLLAKAVNCLDEAPANRPCNQCENCRAVNEGRFLDLIEIDAASNTSVDDVRDLRDKISFSPNVGKYKVYIIDEVHMLSTAAFNALLKTLEEPPPHAMFILATTEAHRIPATVLSRCQRHEFRRISVNEIVAFLERIVAAEGLDVEPEALRLVARQATGAMRDAISLLDQLTSTGQKVTLAMAQAVLGTATNQAVLAVWEALLAGNSAAGLEAIHQALDSGSDPRQFARQVVEFLRSLLMARLGDASQLDLPPEDRELISRYAAAHEPAELMRLVQVFNRAAVEGRAAWMPALPLEMAFLEALQNPAAISQPQPGTPIPASQPSRKPGDKPPAPPPDALAQPAIPKVKGAEAPQPLAADPANVAANQRLNACWERALTQIRQVNPNLYGLVNSARTRNLDNGILTLGFVGDILKTKMEREENLRAAQEVLSRVLGEPVVLRCEVISGQQRNPPPGVASDGIVASALRDLGGEIVDIQ